MQATNKVQKQASKAAMFLAALFVSAVAIAQPVPAIEAKIEPAAPARRIVVSIPDRQLALIENGAVKSIFPVSVGKESTPSPAGTFHVVSRLVNPTYYHQGKVISPGPANPIGTRWMGLSEHGYGIHGTNAPHSIGKAASHGCIRMARADLEQLFAMVQVGDRVEIRAERDEETMRLFGPAENTELADAAPGAANTAN